MLYHVSLEVNLKTLHFFSYPRKGFKANMLKNNPITSKWVFLIFHAHPPIYDLTLFSHSHKKYDFMQTC